MSMVTQSINSDPNTVKYNYKKCNIFSHDSYEEFLWIKRMLRRNKMIYKSGEYYRVRVWRNTGDPYIFRRKKSKWRSPGFNKSYKSQSYSTSGAALTAAVVVLKTHKGKLQDVLGMY